MKGNSVRHSWKSCAIILLHGTILPNWSSLMKNHVSEQIKIMPASLGNNHASITWKQSYQHHLGTIVPASFGNNRASFTLKWSCQCHLIIINRQMKNWTNYFNLFPRFFTWLGYFLYPSHCWYGFNCSNILFPDIHKSDAQLINTWYTQRLTDTHNIRKMVFKTW